MELLNKPYLYTYPNSLGGDLKKLETVANTYLKKAVSGIYILPFYPASGDRGFAALTHLEVEPKFGDWEDIQSLAKDFEIASDVIVNHISTESIYFQDYIHNHKKSKYADMFVPLSKIYQDGQVTLEELSQSHMFNEIPAFINYRFDDGEIETHWKTFFETQAELDQDSELVQGLMESYFANLAKNGIKSVRLDAVHATAKKRGRYNVMVEETYEKIQYYLDLGKKYDLAVFCEIYGNTKIWNRINEMGGWTYDFYLPGLMLNAIFRRNAKYLKKWLARKPKRQITVLGLHDSIQVGYGFLAEVLPADEETFTRQQIFYNAGKSTAEASGYGAKNVDTRGINATFYEAFYRNQDSWLMANAIHLFAPGTPHIYYNDLLAQRNDEELFAKTGEGRSLMRHNHSLENLDHKFQQPGVQRFIRLMEFRNSYPAFDGDLEILDSEDERLVIKWSKGEYQAILNVDLGRFSAVVKYYHLETKTWAEFGV